MASGIVIEGLEQAKRNARMLDIKNHRAAERKGLRTGANVLKKATQARAPSRTGRLRRDVKVAVNVSDKALGLPGTSASARVSINRVGRFHELGTSKMPARPFFRPALEETKDDIARAYGQAFIESVRQRLGAAH